MSYQNANVENIATTGVVNQQRTTKKALLENVTEDIWAVLMAGIIIVGVLALTTFVNDFKFQLPLYQWANKDELVSKVLSLKNILLIAQTGLLFLVLSGAAIGLSGGSIKNYVAGFLLIYVLAVIALIVAGNTAVSYYGLEYVIFALCLGLLIGNLTKVPAWVKEAARSEFFIKTGLIIYGTSILFTDIVKAGLPGLLQSVLVVSAVWFVALWISRKLKVDDEFGVILASAVAICGVSAAIVASGAIKGDKKKLSYVTTLVLLVAIPMLVLQPWIIKILHIPEIVGGAWLGGTLDTTASVSAAAELVGPKAVKAGVIVKFSQNVLIGIAAFFIALWWTYRKGANNQATEKPGLGVVWERFPKFVLGFVAASLVFSFLIPAATIKNANGVLGALRTVWFALAFVAIGLEARFADLVKNEGGRPALAFIAAQFFNIIWTLLWAYLLFSGILLPLPDLQ
ncbi:putative sulfate exporter family transporter [Niastella caeni]|uniref:Putative sulfate exporter family transporter n=1 Tax=Niastella caeni TaxID=2569763 RepID=A0A4S8HZK5_9BACT|nr:putative sulfate exporter family transporter [Niastella caeni]THU40279.1 putative sulfate exporter family transporter [Niastella caeni]